MGTVLGGTGMESHFAEAWNFERRFVAQPTFLGCMVGRRCPM